MSSEETYVNPIDSKENVDPTQKPPMPPRTAFMCFSASISREIAAEVCIHEKSNEILKHVAAAWKRLDPREKADWDEAARSDKMRYVREKAAYKGEWDIPKRRAKKHPLAPKRPMSAFLKYSQTRRPEVKKQNPDMSNTDVSRLLGEMWRSASPKSKAPYVEREEVERSKYKIEIAKFNTDQARLDAASRTNHNRMQPFVVQEYSNTPYSQRDDVSSIFEQRAPRVESVAAPNQHDYSDLILPSMNSYGFNALSFDFSEPLPPLYPLPTSRQTSASREHFFGDNNRDQQPPRDARDSRRFDHQRYHSYEYYR